MSALYTALLESETKENLASKLVAARSEIARLQAGVVWIKDAPSFYAATPAGLAPEGFPLEILNDEQAGVDAEYELVKRVADVINRCAIRWELHMLARAVIKIVREAK